MLTIAFTFFISAILSTSLFSMTDSIPSGMVKIPAGSFLMGSPPNLGGDDELPQHAIFLDAFFIDQHEVTQEAFTAVMGNNPSSFAYDPQRPVETVNWNDASAFCKKVGKRLPTEAEWEYACRAGSNTAYFWGDSIDRHYAWFEDNSRKRSMNVEGTTPNSWGLYDMSGNVWEWCSDFYSAKYYLHSAKKNPRGPTNGSSHVLRGGSWASNASSLRSAIRNTAYPDMTVNDLGFRCAKSMKK